MNSQLSLFVAKWISLGFGSGKAPVAPGTFGTLVAVPMYLALIQLPLVAYIGVTVLLLLLGIWASHVYSDHLGVHDHGSIVWDEVVGYLITMTLVPVHWLWIVLGFALFRLFDIWKPWPIRLLDEQVHGGFGIMIDDVLAGIYAMICLYLIYLIAG